MRSEGGEDKMQEELNGKSAGDPGGGSTGSQEEIQEVQEA